MTAVSAFTHPPQMLQRTLRALVAFARK